MRFSPIFAALLVLTASAPEAIAQVPPPPPLPEQPAVATGLVRVFAEKDVRGYEALLAPNVQVFEDGILVARDRASWLKSFGKKLSAEGVSFRLCPGYASTGRLLFVEYFNSVASWSGERQAECCWGYDAVAYDITHGKVQVIRWLRGGPFRLGDTGEMVPNEVLNP
ncbi:hypothetical protein [Sphingomonas sp. 3-13AW]|uniref:hypothetical protein n=1 Tax=Sphingomonas sp. 3-13AW TaxID=3050450 RepID=UPI003BB5BF9F